MTDIELCSAAFHLGAHLNSKQFNNKRPWLSSIGIAGEAGNKVFVVYTNEKLPVRLKKLIPEIWEGVPVRIQEIGVVVAA